MPFIDKCRIIYGLLDGVDKRRLSISFWISMLNGLLNAAGVASILPFIGLVTDPEILETSSFLIKFQEFTGIDSYAGTVVGLGLMALVLLIIGNTVAAFDSWYGERFGAVKDMELSAKLLDNYLGSDVLEFEKRKSAERAKEILSDVDRVIISSMFSILDLISELIVSGCIIFVLLRINWSVTVVLFAVLVTVHFIINSITSRRLARLGKEYSALEGTLFNHVLEALKLNKEIKMNGLSPFFVKRFSSSSDEMVRNSLASSLTSDIPQQLLEIAAFMILLCVALYFTVFSGDGGQSVAIIGMYAVAAYRLIPSVAHIFDRIEGVWYDTAILEELADALNKKDSSEDVEGTVPAPKETIALKEIDFAYSKDSAFHLEHYSVEFKVNQFTCIKGRTGCGKSTVMNLLAGLYRPSAGTLQVDGVDVDAYRNQAWKKQIGLVPAAVNLIQLSLYENIALGQELNEIDRERVHEIGRLVELDDVVDGLARGYDSEIGDDGLSFSSGQIQKIGIARAMYRNPSLLLLDESTNAFDLDTETRILDRLKAIEGLTIVFISHRPSVMEHADHIVDLESHVKRKPLL